MSRIEERQPVRAAAAAFFGTTIEWYDYFCYATAAALVFGDVFFSTGDRFTGLLASLVTFAVGFVARPFGAILFGHLGDKIGRKQSLILTLWLMGGASTLIGLIPSYDSIGVTAAVALVVLRFVQGIAVGGEWGGAVLIASEHAPARWKTILAAAPQYGSPVGLILATSAFQMVSSLPEADFKSWGWRLPFLASAVMVLVAYFIRRGVNESPELEAHRREQALKQHKEEVAPLRALFAEHKRRVAFSICMCLLGIAGFYFITTLMISYTTNFLQVAKPDILKIITFMGVIQLIATPIGSLIATKIGERTFIIISAAATALWAFPMMNLIQSADIGNIRIGLFVATALIGMYYAVLAAYLPRVFPIGVRYTGISLSFQACGAIFGGTTPLVGLWLVREFGAHAMPLAILFCVIGAATCLGAVCLPSERRAREEEEAASALKPLSASR